VCPTTNQADKAEPELQSLLVAHIGEPFRNYCIHAAALTNRQLTITSKQLTCTLNYSMGGGLYPTSDCAESNQGVPSSPAPGQFFGAPDGSREQGLLLLTVEQGSFFV
jgi:hypothetical protein